MSDTATADYAPVSVEDEQGRILTGVGVTKDALESAIDAAQPETDAEAPTEAQPVEPIEKPSRGKKRFDQLTGEREAARREADEAKREAAELKAQLAKLQSAPQMPPPSPSAPPVVPAGARVPSASAAAPMTREKPSEDQVGTKYQTYADFVEDLADWKAEQRVAAQNFDARIRQALEADRASRTFLDKANSVLAKAKESDPAFEGQWAQYLSHPAQLAADPVADQRRVEWLLDQPHADTVLRALARDPALTPKLAALDDFGFAQEVARLAPPPAVATPASTAAASVSLPPTPYQPVGAGSKTTAPTPADMIKRAGFDYDKSGMREYFAAQRRGDRHR